MDRVLLPENTVEKDDIVYFVERGTWAKSERKHVKDDLERGTPLKSDDIVYFVERGMWVKSDWKHVEDLVESGRWVKSDVEDDLETGMRLKYTPLKLEREHVEDDDLQRGPTMTWTSERKNEDEIVYFIQRGTWVKLNRKHVEDDLERVKPVKLNRKHVGDDLGMPLKWKSKYKKRKLTVFDYIPPPNLERRCGGVFRVSITEENRPRLTQLCEIALEKYNQESKQGPIFEVDSLVKSNGRSNRVYFITFKAKPKPGQDPDPSTTIFQAYVWDRIGGPPEVVSCAIKID